MPDKCAYKSIDSINKSAKKISDIIDDAKESVPDFYNELQGIIKDAESKTANGK